jgi:hypothetical protein
VSTSGLDAYRATADEVRELIGGSHG